MIVDDRRGSAVQARGWLIDVYETVLRVDLRDVGRELAALADVPADGFGAAIRPFGEPLNLGTATWDQAFAAVLRACERDPSADLVEELVRTHERLLVEYAEVFDDGVDLLDRLRAAGARTALVSNCAPHTRNLLARLGLDRCVDHVVLSCEVGLAKPDPAMYHLALDRLDVTAADAVLVDDQARYCAAAVDLGMGAIQVDRGGDPSREVSGWERSADLTEIEVSRAGVDGT